MDYEIILALILTGLIVLYPYYFNQNKNNIIPPPKVYPNITKLTVREMDEYISEIYIAFLIRSIKQTNIENKEEFYETIYAEACKETLLYFNDKNDSIEIYFGKNYLLNQCDLIFNNIRINKELDSMVNKYGGE